MQIMCIVDEQGDQFLPPFDWVSQCAFPSFGLSEGLKSWRTGRRRLKQAKAFRSF
jgi:hypothetical protein